MSRITNVLSHLAAVAAYIVLLVIATGGIYTRGSLHFTLSDYAQVVVLFIGGASFVGALFFTSWLVEYWLRSQVPNWLDPESAMNSRFEGYWEDHAMRVDTIEQWSCGQRTLLHDLQFVSYLVRRWLFRTRYDVWSSLVGAYYFGQDQATRQQHREEVFDRF